MTKRIFVAASTVVLAVAGVLVTKANMKRAAVAVYYKTAGTGHACKILTAGPSSFFTNTGVNQAVINTKGGASETLWTNSACSNKAYFLGK